MTSFKNATIVVSGGAGGVGLKLVEFFLKKKATCIAIDKKGKAQSNNNNYTYYQADLSNYDSIKRVIADITLNFSTVDLLINAAGTFIADDECNGSPEKIVDLWKDNFMSAFFLSELIFPLLRKSKNAAIINVSSVDSVVASSGQQCEVGTSHDMIYASTKGALNTLTKCLAMKWAKHNIRVNALCPTLIRTPMTDSLLAKKGKEKELIEFIPLGRVCDPADITVGVEMLYRMKMTTGHLLTLDGGYLCQ